MSYALTVDVAFGPAGEVRPQRRVHSDPVSVGLSVESARRATDTRPREASSKGACPWQVRICVSEHAESRCRRLRGDRVSEPPKGAESMCFLS